MKESAFEKACVKQLRNLKRSYWPPKGSPGSAIGTSDRVGCVNGHYVALEFKRSLKDALKKTPRKHLQEYTVFQVEQAGGYGAFVYPENWKIVIAKIKELVNG